MIILIKLLVSMAFVVGLSLIAERVSPRVAGILAGYPLGAAIALFFYGIEIGTGFAADSAVYTLSGLVATQAFVYGYYRASQSVNQFIIPAASAGGLIFYFGVSWLLHFVPLNRLTAVLMPMISIFCFVHLFRKIENVTIARRITLTRRVIVFRAAAAAGIILIITGTARWVGPVWAGLFSAFPVTLFPLMLIVHYTYDRKAVHTIIKNFPRGLGALITYCLSVSIVYPRLGVGAGTVVSFIAATTYLLIFSALMERRA